MQILSSLACDECGASVPIWGEEASRCNYCGTRTQADQQLEEAREYVEDAAAIEADGLSALQFAMYRTSVGGAATGLWFAFMIFVPSVTLIFLSGFLAAVANSISDLDV